MSEWNTETADWYASKYGEYATNRLAVDAIDLAPDAVVVDVGCGTGSALRHASTRVTEGRLIGVDPVPRMLEIARERLVSHPAAARVEFREGSGESLPLEDGVADIALALGSIDHFDNRADGLREIRRVLMPRGRLVVVKDGGVPGGEGAKRAFLEELETTGFHLVRQVELCEGEVQCTLWECTVNG